MGGAARGGLVRSPQLCGSGSARITGSGSGSRRSKNIRNTAKSYISCGEFSEINQQHCSKFFDESMLGEPVGGAARGGLARSPQLRGRAPRLLLARPSQDT